MLVMAGRWFRVCCVYPQDCHAAGQFNDLPFFVITFTFGHTQSLLFSSLPFHCPYRATETRQKASIPIDISLQNRL